MGEAAGGWRESQISDETFGAGSDPVAYLPRDFPFSDLGLFVSKVRVGMAVLDRPWDSSYSVT